MPSHSLRLFNKIKLEYCCDGILFLKNHSSSHPWRTFHVNLCVYILESQIVWVLQDRDWGEKSVTVELQGSFMKEGGHKPAAKQR